MNEVKEESNDKRKIYFFKKIPRLFKIFIFLIIVLLIIYFGFSNSFRTNIKVTDFGLRDMGELVTQTSYVTVMQDSQVDREFFKLFTIPFTKSRMIFSYDFTVDASVNFEEISYKINDITKEISVKIPHAKHYKTTIILDSQKVYLDDESLFSRIDENERNKAKLEMEDEATNTAINNNLLVEADNNAKRIITALFKSDTTIKDYKITFEYID